MPITTEQMLLEYAKTMIKDFGKEDARTLLLRNVDLWREHYGETVTNRVIKGIREQLREGAK